MIRAAIVATLLATPAVAQNVDPRFCGSYEDIVAMISDGQYQERLTANGLAGPQLAVELWVDPITGTFTVLKRSAEGTACMIASGQAWGPAEGTPLGEPT